jgi:UDP-N-acetylmuramoylalanine--D-glutamate ligase
MQTVLVVGLGKSGIASAQALAQLGARVIATDEKPPAELRDEIAHAESLGARFVTPSALGGELGGVTLAVLSPGVPPVSPVATQVRAAGVPAIGEVELAARLCRAPIVAVTGTKGKSTTAALIAHLLRACGKDARLGGNIGEPLVNAVRTATARSWVVAELSSFQLETIVSFHPVVSVLLNIAPDHLDRYASLDDYAAAKFRIFERQGAGDTIVLDRDDPRLASLERAFVEGGCAATRLWYTAGGRVPGVAMWSAGGEARYSTDGSDGVAVFDRTDVPLRGEHNVRNAMAAALAALAAGCDPAALREAVRTFTALPHRLARVAEIDGVLYVDDSKATNPAAAAAALRAFDAPVVLIAGGRDKNADFSELGAAIAQHARSVVAIGEAAVTIARAAGGVPVHHAASMEEAVDRARRAASAGDVVLLAPACASFDMFANAEDRGEQFVRAVETLEQRSHA